MKRGQVAMEFLLFAALAVFMIVFILIIVFGITEQKNDEKAFHEIEDYGISLQRELILASEMENGYIRKLYVPYTVNGKSFTTYTNQTSAYNGFLVIRYNNIELFYVIPVINGTLIGGDNWLKKINNTLRVSQ